MFSKTSNSPFHSNFACLLLLLLLNFLHFASTAFASQFHICNCMRLKDCKPYTTLLLNHKTHDREMVFQLVRDASCGFDALDPLVCCPTEFFEEELSKPYIGIDDLFEPSRHSVTTRNLNAGESGAWIWDRKPKPLATTFSGNEDELNMRPVARRFGKIDGDALKKDFNYESGSIFDFKDPKTQRNCPHSFYEEIDDNNSDKRFQHFHYHNHHYNNHNNPFHHDPSFHKHFTHEHEANRDREFNSHFDGSDDTFHSNFGSSGSSEEDPIGTLDASLLYPDDKLLHRPFVFPTPPTRDILNENAKKNPEPNFNNTAINRNEVPSTSSFINTPQCGIGLATRILGGVQSSPGQYPWITRIAYLNKTSNRISYRCSGSVISNLYILTAAHCVVNLVSDLELSHARIGDAETTSSDCQTNAAGCRISNTFQISDVIVHPNYDQPKYANDIAILKIVKSQNTREQVNYTSICLPLNITRSVINQLIGRTGVAAGWSTNNEGSETTNPTVKYLRLPIVNTTECAITYAKYSENFNDPIVITPSQLCAQGQPMNDVCRGDSGGPFMDDGTSDLISSNGRHTLLGIVAFGPTICGETNIPGVYTLVSSYMNWIVQNIR